jgi:hypothetical protein
MSFENSVEKIISEAVERGEFDNLKGKGKRIDLNDYFNTPEELRMAYSVLKANEFVPKEVELLHEINDLKTKIQNAESEEQGRALAKRLQERELALRIEIERRGKRRR